MTTNLTSVSTFGWYSSPESTDSLVGISTFGWYPSTVVPEVGVTVVASFPIEIQTKISSINNLPIDIVGETRFWVLDRRGTLWRVPERDNDWTPVCKSPATWIINPRDGIFN